jgi:hypothetical protein
MYGQIAAQFAISIEADASNMGKVKAGKRGLSEAEIYMLHKVHSIRPAWLMFGEGDIYESGKVSLDQPDIPAPLDLKKAAVSLKVIREQADLLEAALRLKQSEVQDTRPGFVEIRPVKKKDKQGG